MSASHTSAAEPLSTVPGLIAPDARGEEAIWFERCRERRLSFQRCDGCAVVLFPPRGACPACGGTTLSWEDSRGDGVVYSYTVQRRRARADMPDVSTIVLVDVAEGFRIMSRLVGDPDVVHVGMPVRVEFAAAGDAVVPVFVVDSAAAD